MDRETARKMLDAVWAIAQLSDSTNVDNILDKLEKLGVIDKPKKQPILELEWKLESDRPYAGNETVRDKHGVVVCFNDWLREIAALPDMARALVKVREKFKAVMGIECMARNKDSLVMISINAETWTLVKNTLEKAGVE